MKMIKYFHRLLLITVPPAALLFSCGQKQAALRLAAVQTDSGWGYRIWHHRQPVIYQVSIPAIPGHHPFRSKADALRTGSLVMRKLQHGQSPAVSRRELDSLGIRPY